MVVTGEDWNGKLAQIKNHRTLVQPEVHRPNDSVYAKDTSGPAPIHPREALGRKLLEVGGPATDMIVFIELVVHRGWPVEFLEGVGIWRFPGASLQKMSAQLEASKPVLQAVLNNR